MNGRTGVLTRLCHGRRLDCCNDGQLPAWLQVAKRKLALLKRKLPCESSGFLHNSYSLSTKMNPREQEASQL
jgi:hypothetical protein